jgi:hypothetical protein
VLDVALGRGRDARADVFEDTEALGDPPLRSERHRE